MATTRVRDHGVVSPVHWQEQHGTSPLGSFIDVLWQHILWGGGQTMLPLPWKELIPSILSGQWLSSDVMGWGVKLWMKKHSVDDADYSSLLPPEPLLSGGISHQRDEDWITLRGKISRLQAWYHHLDYGLDLGFPNFLKSTIPHLSL